MDQANGKDHGKHGDGKEGCIRCQPRVKVRNVEGGQETERHKDIKHEEQVNVFFDDAKDSKEDNYDYDNTSQDYDHF